MRSRSLGALAAVLIASSAWAQDKPASARPDAAPPPVEKAPGETIEKAVEESKSAIDTAKEATIEAIEKARKAVKEALEKAKEQSGPALDKAKQATSEALDKAKQATREVLDKAKAAAEDVLDAAKGETGAAEGPPDQKPASPAPRPEKP